MRRRPPATVDPQAFQRIVGATFTKAEHHPIIRIGSRTWSKWDLGKLGCPHPAAAHRVARMIAQLRIRTEREFVDRAHEFGGFKSMGVTCYWLVLALASALGADIETVHGSDRSFLTIHRRALKPATRRRRRAA